MFMATWRKELDLLIESRLNELIKETKNYDDAIRLSDDKGKAQIWVALAVLYDKIKRLESALKNTDRRIPSEELDKILKIIEKL